MRRFWLNGLAGALVVAMLPVSAVPAAPGAAKQAEPAAAPARGLPDNQLAPLSLSMLQTAEAQLAAGDKVKAMDSFESALAADPRNRQAWLGMARTAQAQGLPGRAVRYYREALALEPNDLQALELQGNVLVERGAKARAQANLERIQKLCTAPCPTADRLAAAIARGPVVTAVAAPTTTASVTPAEDKGSN